MKEKNYGVDALRILSMFMVVILHILGCGGVLNAADRFSGQYEAGWFLESAAYCAVDAFALVSGYVWVNAKYRYRNFVELWLEVLFYSVSITALLWVFAPGSVSALDGLKAFFPVMFEQYWYFSSYAALFLFIPLLNIVLEKMDKKQLTFFLGMILFFFSCVQTLFFSNAFGTKDGYSSVWLIVLYLVGGYIRKYKPIARGKPIVFLAGYFLMVCITWLSKLAIELLTLCVLGEVRAGNFFINYKSPMVLLAAIFLLLFFERITISPSWEKVIRFFSPMAFGVYLIHIHPLVISVLLRDRFTNYAMFSWWMEIIAVLGTALLINLFCYAIDFIRLKLFQKLQLRRKLDTLEETFKARIF